MRKIVGGVVAAIMVGGLGGYAARASEDKNKERYELAELLERAKVSLAQGLTAAEAEGTPSSGKFEVENGKLQLSVYTTKDNKFSEVIVDHTTGKVAKVEEIAGGEDLAAAQSQSAAIVKGSVSLRHVLDKVVSANPGFAAVSITPALKEGHPVAEVILINDEGEELRTVSEKLD